MSRLLVIDTETGGLEPSQSSILSLAAVVWEDGHVRDSFEVFIAEPEIHCDAEAYAVHHIDAAWLSDHGSAPDDAIGDATATAQFLSELVTFAKANLQASRALP